MTTPPPTDSAARPAGRGWVPTFGQVAACVSILGLAALSFLAGAAVTHFRTPLAAPLGEGFAGAQQQFGMAPGQAKAPPGRAELRLEIDSSERTCDGFTIYTSTDLAEARLLDMRGQVVHSWKPKPPRDWPRPSGVSAPSGDVLHFEQCQLSGNGELLALCSAASDSPYGFALAKFDKDSNLVWCHWGAFHHDLDTDDQGRVYTISQRVLASPQGGFIDRPMYIADSLVILSPDGKTEEIPLLKAFEESPYLVSLQTNDQGEGPFTMPSGPGGMKVPLPTLQTGDVTHANSVKVVRGGGAGRFAAGQVLLSLRTPSLLAVLDVPRRRVVWAARGPWRHQHDAQPLPSGRILLFDNAGWQRGARALEYDPETQALEWVGRGDRAAQPVPFRGRCQRLGNGNTLLVDPLHFVSEMTPAGEVVWKLAFAEADVHSARNITGARRYTPDQLPFLARTASARPR